MNASTRCKAGYTTESGVIKPHLQSFLSFTSHPKADINYFLRTEKVKVIGISQAMDGTALKPGLEFDSRQKRIIGLSNRVDRKFVDDHPNPDPEEIRKKLVTNAEVTFITSIDNSSTMPVGVHYLPKSVSGEEVLSEMSDTAKTVQTCERCLKKQSAHNHIVTHETAQCLSRCETCLEAKAVCHDCYTKGQVSHIPALRSCDSCLKDSVECRKTVVLVVVTDCEECNKKALLTMDKMSAENNLPPELLLVSPIPDVVHLGKSLKCSWSNWFIELDRQKSNLVLLRTLRDSTEPEVRKQLRKLLSLECVRNKDKMAVEPIVRLTRPEVAHVLDNISFVVHSIVPEKYRFWNSNLPGVCSHPVAVSSGPLGNVLVIDYDLTSRSSRLLKIRLHQPADVCEEEKGFIDARDLCFTSGVAFVAERGNKTIRYVDLNGSVSLKPNSIRSRAELESTLRSYGLSVEGTVPTLRQRLRDHLKQMAAKLSRRNCVQIQPPLSKPSAVCIASDDVLLCADDGQKSILQVTLEKDGVTINGKAVKLVDYPEHVDLVESLTVCGHVAYFVGAKSSRHVGGLYGFHLEGGQVEAILKNESTVCSEIKKVAVFKNTLAFTDSGARQIKAFDPVDKAVTVLVGNGQEGSQDGTAKSCSFVQAQGICSVGETLFVTDAAAGCVKLVTGLSGTTTFLKHLGLLYDSFGITCKGTVAQQLSPHEVLQNVVKVDRYIKSTVSQIKQDNNLKESSSMNGPQGTVSQKTQQSLGLLERGIERFLNNINMINPGFAEHIDWTTLLTTQVENLHAVSHFKHDTFSVLQYALDFGTISKESLKRITKWSAGYYTHPASYYPVPQSGMPFHAANFMTPLPRETISKEQERAMKEWMENYRPVRQRTVRSETTKDKAGALPPAVYAKLKPVTSCEKVCFRDMTENESDAPVASESNVNTSHESHEDAVAMAAVTFVSDKNIPLVRLGLTGARCLGETEQVDEFESESDSDIDHGDDEELADAVMLQKHSTTRSGRQIRASVRLDI